MPNLIVGRITLALDCGDDGDFVLVTYVFPLNFVYNDGQPHSVSFMFDGDLTTNNLRLVIDGVDVSLTLNTRGMFANSNIITIGKDYGSELFYKGDILELIIQNTALEPERAIICEYFKQKWCACGLPVIIPPTISPTIPPSIPPAIPPSIPPSIPPTVPPTAPPFVPTIIEPWEYDTISYSENPEYMEDWS